MLEYERIELSIGIISNEGTACFSCSAASLPVTSFSFAAEPLAAAFALRLPSQATNENERARLSKKIGSRQGLLQTERFQKTALFLDVAAAEVYLIKPKLIIILVLTVVRRLRWLSFAAREPGLHTIGDWWPFPNVVLSLIVKGQFRIC